MSYLKMLRELIGSTPELESVVILSQVKEDPRRFEVKVFNLYKIEVVLLSMLMNSLVIYFTMDGEVLTIYSYNLSCANQFRRIGRPLNELEILRRVICGSN